MMPAQLKETTMRPGRRTLIRVGIAEDERADTEDLVERLMGKKPELRFQFIQENAAFAKDVDIWGKQSGNHGAQCRLGFFVATEPPSAQCAKPDFWPVALTLAETNLYVAAHKQTRTNSGDRAGASDHAPALRSV